MFETMLENPLLIPSLVGALVVLHLVVVILVLRLSARVARLSRLLALPGRPAGMPGTEAADRRESHDDRNKWFAAFLAEDPARGELPKKEQFAAFRRWREEKGLNWKNPGDPA